MSIATGYLLRWVRWRGAKPPVENTIVLAIAYLSFYIGQSPAKVRSCTRKLRLPALHRPRSCSC